MFNSKEKRVSKKKKQIAIGWVGEKKKKILVEKGVGWAKKNKKQNKKPKSKNVFIFGLL